MITEKPKLGERARIAQLKTDLRRLTKNQENKDQETPTKTIERLIRSYTRYGRREVRFQLTGARDKAQLEEQGRMYRAFEFIDDTCRGTFIWKPIKEASMAKRLKCSTRHLRRILHKLDTYRLILRLESPGAATSFKVPFIDSDRYQDDVEEALDTWLPRIEDGTAIYSTNAAGPRT